MKSQFFRTMIIIGLFGSSNLLSAWNVLYSSTSIPGKGSSQNICRNLRDTGSLTASVWVENGASPIVSKIHLIEVDDRGDIIAQNTVKLTFPVVSMDVKRIEIHRLLINQDSNSYILFGTAHNPVSTFPSTRSFLMKIDNSLNVVQVQFLDEYFDYYDFAITPRSGQFVCVGTIGIFDRLKSTGRRAVITTLNSNFICQGLNLLPQSFPLSGNISRFDNIKVVKAYYDRINNKEILFIAGHTTVDYISGLDTFYFPQLFSSKIEIGGTGNLTHVWFSNVDTKSIGMPRLDEVTPCDLIYDESRNQIAIINSNADKGTGGFLKAHLCLLEATNGNTVAFYTYEGPSTVANKISVHTVFGQTIQLKSSGKYCINGWADNYIFNGPQYGKYNFYQVDFDPQTSFFDSMHLIVGRSSSYLSSQVKDFYGIFTDTGYNRGTGFDSLGPYYTSHSMIVYKDSNNIDQEVVAWMSTGLNNNNHELRIWSSKFGQGDEGPVCLGSYLLVNSAYSPFNVIQKTIVWQFVPCIEFSPGFVNPLNNDFDMTLCNGTFD
jgi:hypothetical protein